MSPKAVQKIDTNYRWQLMLTYIIPVSSNPEPCAKITVAVGSSVVVPYCWVTVAKWYSFFFCCFLVFCLEGSGAVPVF